MLTLDKSDPSFNSGRHTVTHKQGSIEETHEIVVCKYAPPSPEIVPGTGEVDHFHVKQMSSTYDIKYDQGFWENQPECGSKVHLAVVGAGSEYDPWLANQVTTTQGGRLVSFSDINTWVAGNGDTSPLVKGTFRVKVDGMAWITQYDLPFTIQVIDCAEATLVRPAGHNVEQTKLYDGSSFTMEQPL